MELLEAVVQPYDWGSRHVIAELQRRPAPTSSPEAELWMGAHPSAPSMVRRDGIRTPLDELVAADPVGMLGADCVHRFGPRLPFLLKVLAADKPLSIQAHPDRDQAAAGWAREEELGLPRALRNYVDDWPKPEILCALTPFEVLAGFRDPQDAGDLLTGLRVPELAPAVEALRGGGADGPVEALRLVLGVRGPARDRLLTDVVAACRRAVAPGGDPGHRRARQAAVRLAREHEDDLGVVASLLLQHAVLQPGEGLSMPAGGPHAYMRGAGVEVLANSDNVLRAGLTSKRVDVGELLRVLRPDAQVPVLRPAADADGVRVYDSGAPEFRLYRVHREGGAIGLPGRGPRIVLSVGGPSRLCRGRERLVVPAGGSCFVPAGVADVRVEGPATLFVACPGG